MILTTKSFRLMLPNLGWPDLPDWAVVMNDTLYTRPERYRMRGYDSNS